jgi:hypothetical protein
VRFTQTQKLIYEISVLENELRVKYPNLNISFEDSGELKKYGYSADFLKINNLTSKLTALTNLQRALAKYPPWMVNSLPSNIYLANNIKFQGKNNKEYFCGGLQMGNSIYINLAYGVHSSFFHEFGHLLDRNDGMIDDNVSWANINKRGMQRYTNTSWRDAIENNNHLARFKDIYTIGLHEFARTYGQRGGPDEDQATIIEFLFSQNPNPFLIKKCAHNERFRTKVEVITGCKFNPRQKRFDHTYTAEEYVQNFGKYGFTEPQYFAKWSRQNPQELPVMNHEYWNALFDKKNITWESDTSFKIS